MNTFLSLRALVATFALCASAVAQEPTPKIPVPKMPTAQDSKQEMIDLFHQVESKMQEIDRLLYDAGAGGAAGSSLKDAGIDKLLRDAGEKSRSVQAGIDRILELAREQQQQQQSSSSGGSSGSDPNGQSPLDQQRSGQQQKEKKPGGEAPDQQDEQNDPNAPKKQGGQPKNPKDSKDESQRTGANPPNGPKGSPSNPADARELWGELPEQARDVFRVQGGGDLPPRYRDFIDSYYRRMSRRP
ncbi:MAG: hypothetical protein K8S98_13910 [Planctomycetes bacterium]|nr:hypothetical protein [Planctomycetota bacterium]